MARIRLERGRYGGLALSAAGALWLACAGQPAVAGDDGAAPIWSSLGSVFGLDGDKDEPDIDYRDRPRLVLPPKMDLPPPAASPLASATDWPRDPDVNRWYREQAEKKALHPMRMDPTRAINNKFPDTSGVVTSNFTAGMGPSSQRKCAAGPGQSCDSAPSPTLNWNPLTWVGIQKKPVTVLGPEPARTSLTDPPPGYREPAEGAGAKVDDN
jgi:hypothetical protein